jgi:hypothetical protein
LSDIARRGQFAPGVSGNLDGRPKGARNVLTRRLIDDLAAEWQEGGREALRVLRVEKPDKFVLAALSILPKDVLVRLEDADPSPFADLTVEQKREVAMRIYRELAAEKAKTIEHEPELP